MPFLSSTAANFGYGRGVTSSSSPILSGNATTNMNITGATQVTGVAGVDDAWGQIPTDTSFTFNFFGSNHGGNSNLGINWNTNNVLMFGSQNNTIQWAGNTGRGILIGVVQQPITFLFQQLEHIEFLLQKYHFKISIILAQQMKGNSK